MIAKMRIWWGSSGVEFELAAPLSSLRRVAGLLAGVWPFTIYHVWAFTIYHLARTHLPL
jgi:hypothetical protein